MKKLKTATAFKAGVILNTIYIIVELFFGVILGSVALIADAFHNLSDVVGLIVSWVADLLGKRRPTNRYSYGLKSVSIIAALINALLLLVAMITIITEAITHFNNPQPIAGIDVMSVAFVGVIVNGISALLFMQGKNHDLNVKGAFLHLAADAGVSLAVVVAGLLMSITRWYWLDPAISILVAGFILISTFGLFKDSINLTLQSVPKTINLSETERIIVSCPQVLSYHDLHVWPLGTKDTALTVHVIASPNTNNNDLLNNLTTALEKTGNIQHITIQIENATGSKKIIENKF